VSVHSSAASALEICDLFFRRRKFLGRHAHAVFAGRQRQAVSAATVRCSRLHDTKPHDATTTAPAIPAPERSETTPRKAFVSAGVACSHSGSPLLASAVARCPQSDIDPKISVASALLRPIHLQLFIIVSFAIPGLRRTKSSPAGSYFSPARRFAKKTAVRTPGDDRARSSSICPKT